MKTLLLLRDYLEAIVGLEGQFPDPSHARQTILEDTKLVTPDEKTVALLLCNAIPPRLHNLAHKSWKTVDAVLNNRATAAGTPGYHGLKVMGH